MILRSQVSLHSTSTSTLGPLLSRDRSHGRFVARLALPEADQPRLVTKLLSLLVTVASVLLPSVLPAQASRLVDPLDPAYADLRSLVEVGLVDQIWLANRPLSRRAFRSALAEARRRLGEGGIPGEAANRTALGAQIIGSIEERLALVDGAPGEVGIANGSALLRTLSLDATATSQPTRLIPDSNGIGAIDARLNTLLANRQGRPLVRGASTLLESTHTLESAHFAFDVTPALALLTPTDTAGRVDARLQQLQLRAVYRNVALDVGREYVNWGQGRDVGLLTSNNSPPLDLIKLSNEEPFTFPWIFRHLGRAQFSILYADLGGDQNFPHPYAVAYHGSIAPAAALELGATVYTKSGGRGGPPATFTARLIDLLPFLDASAYNNLFGTRCDCQFSDHYAGVDGRLRLAPLQGAFFWEVLLNDFDVRRLTSVLWEDAGHVVGLEMSQLADDGRLGASVEYHHTGIRYYEHHQFTSGQTIHQTLMGDPLGPDAQGLYANLDWRIAVRRRASIQLAIERRSHDEYELLPEPNFGFRRTIARLKEWQGRVMGTWELLPYVGRVGGLMQLGYARTRNFDFVDGRTQNGVLARVAVQYRFR